MKKPYTVVGTMAEDNEERVWIFVYAENPAKAEQTAIRDTPEEIVIASVFNGHIEPASTEPSAPTPIASRSIQARVSNVMVTRETVRLPVKCPDCDADLRKPDGVIQEDWRARRFLGHFGKSDNPRVVEDQLYDNLPQGPLAVKLACSKCMKLIWDGVHIDEAHSGHVVRRG